MAIISISHNVPPKKNIRATSHPPLNPSNTPGTGAPEFCDALLELAVLEFPDAGAGEGVTLVLFALPEGLGVLFPL